MIFRADWLLDMAIGLWGVKVCAARWVVWTMLARERQGSLTGRDFRVGVAVAGQSTQQAFTKVQVIARGPFR